MPNSKKGASKKKAHILKRILYPIHAFYINHVERWLPLVILMVAVLAMIGFVVTRDV